MVPSCAMTVVWAKLPGDVMPGLELKRTTGAFVLSANSVGSDAAAWLAKATNAIVAASELCIVESSKALQHCSIPNAIRKLHSVIQRSGLAPSLEYSTMTNSEPLGVRRIPRRTVCALLSTNGQAPLRRHSFPNKNPLSGCTFQCMGAPVLIAASWLSDADTNPSRINHSAKECPSDILSSGETNLTME